MYIQPTIGFSSKRPSQGQYPKVTLTKAQVSELEADIERSLERLPRSGDLNIIPGSPIDAVRSGNYDVVKDK